MSQIQHQAIEQTIKHEDCSDKYEHISTRLIIDSLEARGFELDSINVAGVRKVSNQGFQKHLVTMKYNELETADGVPTVIIQNSHNRSSGLKFHTGFIRFACMNGLILGNGIEEQKIRHSSNWKDKATSFLDNYTKDVERMNREHARMKHQHMNPYMIMELANRAVQLRYDAKDVLDPNELTLVRRKQDMGSNAYVVYNRIQEALLQGMFKRRVKNVTDEGEVQYSDWGKAAKITANDEIIRLNKSLREMVLEFA